MGIKPGQDRTFPLRTMGVPWCVITAPLKIGAQQEGQSLVPDLKA
jgi:hypothetical protein